MTWSQSGLRPQSYATWCLCSPPRCYTAHTALALYSVFCWLCDPCNKSQHNEVQSSCISSTKEMYNHIYNILRKICRGGDCQLQKCVPTITQQLLQSIIRGRIQIFFAKIFNCLSNHRKQWQGGCSVCTRAHRSELVMSKANWTAVVAIYNFEIGLSPSNILSWIQQLPRKDF